MRFVVELLLGAIAAVLIVSGSWALISGLLYALWRVAGALA